MSWNINFKVVEGKIDPETIQASTDSAAPPDGSYQVNGHVHHAGDAAPSVSVMTPIGGVTAYLTDAAYQ